jgi:soluble lytic murein transglycosylase-like protein
MKQLSVLACACIIAALTAAGAARADIYKYTDKKGVVHFTNVPTSPQYRLYQKNSGRADDKADYRADEAAIARPVSFRFFSSSDEKRYDKVIENLCSKYAVDTALVKAVIKTESDFDPFAVSSKGAQGLMQLMPGTARDMQVRNPLDPHQNLQGGICYLRQMLDMFNGDMKLALAAYNAGFNTVIQCGWRVPNIPETRDYVQKVMYYIKRYR